MWDELSVICVECGSDLGLKYFTGGVWPTLPAWTRWRRSGSKKVTRRHRHVWRESKNISTVSLLRVWCTLEKKTKQIYRIWNYLVTSVSTHILSGQFSGRSRYPPSMTNFRTCSLDKPWYGCSASVVISHRTTPKDLQTHTHTWRNKTPNAPWVSWDRAVQSIPAVRMGSEDSVLQGFRSHPPDRKQTLPTFTIVVCLIDISGHSKICGS